ncbi:MAG: leucine--tRNA ligase [Candidatus Magasanikbacteria bacterium RIFCSPLOWO2_01_FULL_43_20b]|nr:MAG: leucine--tRNA ligase [Candidatus Magasanikbacteria bacterium RIFCSPLOWO2_02_FULL_43_22]OGH73437.1 MAG: leucine--tRNA ligase [Candidatus Magasanikbacteria bacterium RIFCSPLOWO2_01_FULL_43_20b]
MESKWQKLWLEKKLYKTKELADKPKYYVLDMFPYPSGAGLHVGHPKGYIATDVVARMKMMRGFNVLHPMGWDAFGLPAENYALKNKVHPAVATKKNIQVFKKQLGLLGFTYDWDREINTTDPNYYKWTQWIFLQMFKRGLAYESNEPINWCPSCKTGLANEDLEDGKCERCGSAIEQKPMRQWVLKITDYAERLLKDLDLLDKWPEPIKEMQRNWIGRSEGASVRFTVIARSEERATRQSSDSTIEVFTTRPDTLFGATYVVLAPEHKLIEKLKIKIENFGEVKKYIEQAKNKTALERTELQKEKTGVEIKGVKAINPANGEELPIFVADYVLGGYGTGAIMAVPAHDERDFEFAKKYNLPIKIVVMPDGGSTTAGNTAEQIVQEEINKILSEHAFSGNGYNVKSDFLSGLRTLKAKEKMIQWLEEKGFGKRQVQYKLRDWVFSRQRYWGEPIPLVRCEKCGWVTVPEKDLPLELPKVKHYEPSGTGESPLTNIKNWMNTKCPQCGGQAKREMNTMPQWAGSCWYYLRYEDPDNKKALVDKAKEKYWSPIDLYVGGAEHATRHLIYARFWHKFLYDIGAVNNIEPFTRLQNVGLILAEDGRKMSKRWNNVINPDDVVKQYGADAMRLYEMFMGPFDQPCAWSTQGVVGMYRFLDKVWNLKERVASNKKQDTNNIQYSISNIQVTLNQTIKKVTEDIENLRFNTAISQLMILVNEMSRSKVLDPKSYAILLQLLAPFAPHICEELWSQLGNKKSIFLSDWPKYDVDKLQFDTMKLAVQVNGKVRATIEVPTDAGEEEIKSSALADGNVKKWLDGRESKKVIYVSGRLVSVVV